MQTLTETERLLIEEELRLDVDSPTTAALVKLLVLHNRNQDTLTVIRAVCENIHAAGALIVPSALLKEINELL